MAGEIRLFDINPGLDRAALAASFAAEQRLQIRDVLTEKSARNVHAVLSRQTPWGLAWQAGAEGPHNLSQPDLAKLPRQQLGDLQSRLAAALQGRDYAFLYAQYPMIVAYLQQWAPGGPHDALVELINDAPFMDLMRAVTGIGELIKADAQATLFAPTHFLAAHDDSHSGEGRRVAYVLNMCAEDWRPEWGGYLNFLDEEGDLVHGYRPRFNTLNLFRVPQRHLVSFVPSFAPVSRFAITGWLRDR